MNITVKNEDVSKHQTEALLVGMFEGEELPADLTSMDKDLNDELSFLLSSKEFKGEKGQSKLIHTQRKVSAKKILLVGLGKEKDFTREQLRRVSATTAKYLREQGVKNYSTLLHKKGDVQAVVEGIILGLYDFKKYVTVDREKIKLVDSVTLLGGKEISKGVDRGTTLANAVCYVRDLVNEPPNKVTPSYLAQEAQKLKAKVKVFGKADIEKMKMGGLLSVSKGSAEEPKFIVIEYGTKGDPIVLVGKGITFDSGGLDIKPAAGMEDMKCDMAGAATVIGTIKAASELGIQKRIIGIIPTCENMIGPRSYRPGDILTAYNGKTVEVWNTDAEGRLILMDALGYAEKNFKAGAMIDIATLTGASIIALGYEIVSLMGSDKQLVQKMLDASKKTDEMMWELPLYDDYKDLVKGDIGDVRNISKEAFGPGTITAGLFLQTFVEKTPWVHLDIGASGWAPSDKAYKKKGGTGICLRTFIQLIEDY